MEELEFTQPITLVLSTMSVTRHNILLLVEVSSDVTRTGGGHGAQCLEASTRAEDP